METLHHILYHELITDRCSLSDAVRTIEKVLLSSGKLNADALCRDAVRLTEGDAAVTDWSGCPDRPEVERTYQALLVKMLFDSYSEEAIRDIINLAHKEALARQIDILLRNDPVDLSSLERLLAEFAKLPVGESQVSPSIALGVRVQLISLLISDNLFYVGIAKNHITIRDAARLMDRFVGKRGARGRIGGKSAGVILANRILRPSFGEATGLEDKVAEVESYFLTAEVFNRFIEHNRLQEGHSLKYMEPDEREAAQSDLERRFARGSFPSDLEESLKELLGRFDEGPLIVRSSSLLEDSMGFPFYGKYDSVFVTNQGSWGERFDALLAAVKSVYISILSSSVLEYRKDKALLDYDDMMCVLVQRVVGARHGRYFFPDAAGVAFSRNQYRWSPRIEPEAGVIRLVYGLGTTAVDRSGDDYPRLIALSHPQLRPESTMREQVKYSQRSVDVLNLEKRDLESVHFTDLVNEIRQADPAFTPNHAISIASDDRLQSPLFFPETLNPGEAAISFDGLLGGGQFAPLIRSVLAHLEEAYQTPVDVEFALHEGKLYVLQCRPLAQGGDGGQPVTVPTPSEDQKTLFRTTRSIFQSAHRSGIRFVVIVDGGAYHELSSESDKLEVARLVGRANRRLEGERYMLIGPGRWGTNNLELGVRVRYGDINHATILAEVGSSRAGYTPEVSYGTHFYQDLVEADIVPLALFPDEAGESFGSDMLMNAPDELETLVGATELPVEAISRCVRVIDLETAGLGSLEVWLSSESSEGIGLLSRQTG